MTTKNENLDERFEASLDAPGSLPDPVATGDNKRPADKTDGEKAPKALTKAQMISGITHSSYKLSHPELTAKYKEFFALSGENVSDVHNKATIKAGGLKEDIDAIFEGSDLSEDFKDKANTLFEAAVNSAIVVETARLEEEFEERLEEEVANVMETMTDAISKYIAQAADKWLEENKLAVESGLRSEISESFLASLKNVFVEHYVEVPDEAVDVVEALSTQVEELTAKLNESKNETIEVTNKLNEATAANIVATVSEGLSESQKDKLSALIESVEFVSEEAYTKAVTQIAETLVQKKAPSPAVDQLNEEVELDESKKTGAIDPIVAASIAALKRSGTK